MLRSSSEDNHIFTREEAANLIARFEDLVIQQNAEGSNYDKLLDIIEYDLIKILKRKNPLTQIVTGLFRS